MKYYIFFLLGFSCISAQGQLKFYTIQEVFEFADKNAISIQQSNMAKQIALEEKKEARSYLLPSASGTIGYNDNITLQPTLVPAQFINPEAPDDAFQELTFGTKYQYSIGFQIQWDVLNFQKLFNLQMSEINISESEVNVEKNKYLTYNQLASTYYSILLTEETINIYQENMRLAETIWQNANEKYQEGLIAEDELNRAEIKLIQNQNNLTQVKNNYKQFITQLQSQLNTNKSIEIFDKLDLFDLDNSRTFRTHPEISWQEFEVRKYESILKQNKAALIPSLGLVYQNNRIWATDEFFGLNTANVLPQQYLGLQLGISGLFSGKNRAKIQQSKWQLKIQQEQLQNTKLVKQKEDDLLELQLNQALDQLLKNRKILELQEKNDTHTENKYQSGLLSLDQRLDRFDDLLKSKDNYLQSLASCTLAKYKIFIRQIEL